MGAPSHRGRRALVSVLVLAALLAVTLGRTWGVSAEDFIEGDGAAILANNPPAYGALGQVLTGFTVVEVIAIVVPALRRRRHDHPRVRLGLTVASFVLGALLALLVGWTTSRFLVSAGMSESVQWSYVASSLGGVVALLAALAALRRWGFGGAWAAVVSAIMFMGLETMIVSLVREPEVSVAQIVIQGAFLAGWSALTWGFLRGRFGRSRAGTHAQRPPVSASGVYRETGRAPVVARLHLRAPLWGAHPIQGTSALDTAISALVVLGIPGAGVWRQGWVADPWVRAIFAAAFALAAMALFDRLPTSIRGARAALSRLPGEMAASLDDERADARRATRTMALAVVALELLGGVTHQPIHGVTMGLIVMICTALAMDLVDEWRACARLGALTPVAYEQRVWFADALAAALEAHGVPTFTRSANVRQLTWWTMPHVPVAVLVPVARHDEARALIATWEAAGRLSVGDGDVALPRRTGDEATMQSSDAGG